MVCELYAMLATLARTDSILNNANANEKQKTFAKDMCHLICSDARANFKKNHKRLNGKYDGAIPKISQMVCENDGTMFDITDI